LLEMTRNVMLHSAVGDSIVAFRSVINLSEKYKDDNINLIYNGRIDEFMRYWVWPNNINLMPLNQTCHDFDNKHKFPYQSEDQSIVESFEQRHGNSYDYRPAFVDYVPENNLQGIIPNKAPLLLGLGDYVVIQPMSTANPWYLGDKLVRRCPEEDVDKYQKFLLNLIDEILLYTDKSIALVGNYEDSQYLPAIKAISSHQRCFNLMTHLSIEELCDTIKHSYAVFGLSSCCIHIGNYIFDKPVISWRMTDPLTDIFDNFLNKEKSKNIGRPWEKDNKFYIDFLSEE
jgi:hypothetical protein